MQKIRDVPTPGGGYTLREYLGGGYWKRAFRATSAFNTADVCLLYFHDESRTDIVAKDVLNLLRATAKHPFSSYLARFHGVQRGQDGRLFIVERLLERPLDRMMPVNDLVLFARIGRDLCRGLTCLHENGLVHRDLKLDNCGMDQLQRAKIFDLGSVTSEPGGIEGTIFTRPPELFALVHEGSLFTSAGDKPLGHHAVASSDIWAMGATLFALRSGSYPFVHNNELQSRRAINTKTAMGKLSKEAAIEKKIAIDMAVQERIGRRGAFSELTDRVHSVLRGRAEHILNSMLSADPGKRRSARDYVSDWTELCNELGGVGAVSPIRPDKWGQILVQLTAIENREFSLTPKQLERLISEINEERTNAVDAEQFKQIDDMLRRVKSRMLQEAAKT